MAGKKRGCMILGGSAYGQVCYGGKTWIEPAVPPVVPPVVPPDEVPPLGGRDADGRQAPKKAFTTQQKNYLTYVRMLERAELYDFPVEKKVAPEKPEKISVSKPKAISAFKISKGDFDDLFPFLTEEFPEIGFGVGQDIAGFVMPEITFPAFDVVPRKEIKIKELRVRPLTNDEIWFLLEEDVL
jgi:hypothetical protein